MGGFGAEPGQVQWVPEKVPEKVPGGFGAEPGQVQQFSGTFSGTLLHLTWLCTKASQTFTSEPC